MGENPNSMIKTLRWGSREEWRARERKTYESRESLSRPLYFYYMWWSGCTLHGIWRLVNIKWEKFCLYCLYIYLDFHRIQWTPDLDLELQLQQGHIYIICTCIVGGGLCSVFPRWRKTDPPAHDLTAARNFVPPLTSPPVSRAERIFSQGIPFLKTREIKNGKMGIEVKQFSIILQWS